MLIYNFLFILLNLSLYFGYMAESIYFDKVGEGFKVLALLFQETVIYLLISVALMLFLLDLLPCLGGKKSTFLEYLIFKLSMLKLI